MVHVAAATQRAASRLETFRSWLAAPVLAYTQRSVMALRKLLIICWLSLVSAAAHADATIELLTIEPGDAIWARYGHTAIRVRESTRDIVFNYGAAPFLKPGFLWNSMRGRADFFVIAEPFTRAFQRYQHLDRTVISQELHLPPEQSQWLIAHLFKVVQPPHNTYRYDQLFDNCATRVRDVIDSASKGALRRAAAKRNPARTFRDDTLEAESGHPFASWGFDLIGGPHQDLPVDGWQELYLPLYLHDRVAEARLEAGGMSVPLAGPSRVLYQRKAGPARWPHKDFVRGLLITLSTLLLALLGAYALAGARSAPLRRATAIAVGGFSAITGIFGLVVVPTTLLSNVHNISPNENAWLFFPVDLFLIRALYRAALSGRQPARWMRLYVGARAALVAIVLALKLVGVMTQHNWVFMLTASAWALSAASLVFARGLARAPQAPETAAAAPPHNAQNQAPAGGRSRAPSRAGLSSRKP
jgi:hypothetical protein